MKLCKNMTENINSLKARRSSIVFSNAEDVFIHNKISASIGLLAALRNISKHEYQNKMNGYYQIEKRCVHCRKIKDR